MTFFVMCFGFFTDAIVCVCVCVCSPKSGDLSIKRRFEF